MGAGLGLGMGFGMGMPMGNAMSSLATNIQTQQGSTRTPQSSQVGTSSPQGSVAQAANEEQKGQVITSQKI